MDGRSDLLALVADPEDPDVVFVSSVRGPYRVDSGTDAWDSVRFPNNTRQHDDARFLAFDRQGNLLEASDGGVYRLAIQMMPRRARSPCDGSCLAA